MQGVHVALLLPDLQNFNLGAEGAQGLLEVLALLQVLNPEDRELRLTLAAVIQIIVFLRKYFILVI